MEIVLSLVAITISLAVLLLNSLRFQTQAQRAALAANHAGMFGVESQISSVPSVLRFHGIEDPEAALERHGLTVAEFGYLLGSFTLGGTYYRNAPEAEAEAGIAPGSYRYMMCAASGTQRAWPLLRRLITRSPYRTRLDQIFAELQNADSPQSSATTPSDVEP